jgi:RND family efflux transporter MFP subunit
MREEARVEEVHGRRRPRRRVVLVLAVLVLVAVLGALLLSLSRQRREAAERARLARAAEEGPKVLVAEVTRPSGQRTVTLPGDVTAFKQTVLYAKVNGYVSEMRVDKGDRVRRGQVLAEVSSPETDQQVLGAEATLANRRLNAERARRLAPRGIVSRQELDQALADLRVAQADLRRVRALQEYETLRAPFDGTVTARFVDPGALVAGAGTGAPVVELADPDHVRVFVYVGQDLAPFVRVGDAAEILLDQQPDARVPATVRRLADALDLRSRSMLVELWLSGAPAVRLVPGLFVHVDLHVAVPPLPSVPADALVARGDKLQVALVREKKLHFVDVEPGTNDGRQLQIRRGVSGGEVVALSPPSDLGEGAPVQPVTRSQRSARAPP